MLTLVAKAARKAIQAVSTAIQSVQPLQVQLVANAQSVAQQRGKKMRNRIDEASQKVKLLVDLSTELVDRGLKTHNNVEFETYMKCSELIQNYASEIMKEEFQNED